MSDELEEKTYRLIETTIDLLNYVVPTNAKIFLATYREIYTPEHKVTRKAGDKIVWNNGTIVFEPCPPQGRDDQGSRRVQRFGDQWRGRAERRLRCSQPARVRVHTST